MRSTYTGIMAWAVWTIGTLSNAVAEPVQYNLAMSWGNRYVTEGVEHVPGARFLFTDASVEWQGLVAGAWWGQALNDSYNEVELWTEFSRPIGPVEWVAGVARVDFPSGADTATWEIYGGLIWPAAPLLGLFLDAVYDLDEIKGGFMELGVFSPWTPTFLSDRFSLVSHISFGLDAGYVSGPRRVQVNHAQFGAELGWTLNIYTEIFMHLNHSVALTHLDREGQNDVTWGGIGASISF